MLTDTTAKAESSYSMTDKLECSVFNDIKNDKYSVESGTRTTLEDNFWLLDGSPELIPDNTAEITWGLWSKRMTDEKGDFEAAPLLNVTFENVHTSAGITITFAGDTFPKELAVTWYCGSAVLASGTYTVDAMQYCAGLTVDGYNAIGIEFIGTAIPYRRIKIAEIDYGEIKVWGKSALISANVLEEINLTSSEITVNTLDFSVHDENGDFNMLNPTGVYLALQKKQLLNVTQYINGEPMPMGKYYLDTWENASSVEAAFTAYDAIGLFDGITYKTSPMWSGTAAGTVFADIFASAGWTSYTIEDAVATEAVYGYIPIVTVREALHQLCFALRAACIPNRDGVVEIKRLPSGEAATAIEKSQKHGSQTIKQNTLVNSVAVTAYSFAAEGSSTELYSETLSGGTYEITFSTPATGVTVSGASINSSGVNFVNITVPSALGPVKVTVTGYQYAMSTAVYTHEASGLTDTTRSQATADSIYLVSASNAGALAKYLYEDYQRRIVQCFGITLADERAGDNVDVDTMLGARKTGVITKLDIDLTGGFLADCEVRG